MNIRKLLMGLGFIMIVNASFAQGVREYTVSRTTNPIQIDGILNEPEWHAAPHSEEFVHHTSGDETTLSKTYAQFLWDDTFLYIAFTCEDKDVKGEYTDRDAFLWQEEEVIEVLCDPTGDGLDYFEIQVNPLNTVLDLLLDKSYSNGGSADIPWNIDSLLTAVHIYGTLNDPSDVDSSWTCEIAVPFKQIQSTISPLNVPPIAGESWRILPTRYDMQRIDETVVELSAWNETASSSFHVPPKFGRIIFSDSLVITSLGEKTIHPAEIHLNIFPNPFNPTTTIEFNTNFNGFVRVQVFDMTGRKIKTLINNNLPKGNHRVDWNAKNERNENIASGVYFINVQNEELTKIRKVVLLR